MFAANEGAVAAPTAGLHFTPALEAALRERAAMAGFDGKLHVIPDPRIGPSDCRIEWADGGVVLERAAIARTEEVVAGLERVVAGMGER